MATDRIAGTTMYLQPGMSVIIRCPVDAFTNQGYFAADADYINNSLGDPASGAFPFRTENPINGFIVINEGVGTIADNPIPSDAGISVIYTHNTPEKNAVWFFAATGERGLVNIVSVPIHDHSSITQGGPAYGTYFSDEETI